MVRWKSMVLGGTPGLNARSRAYRPSPYVSSGRLTTCGGRGQGRAGVRGEGGREAFARGVGRRGLGRGTCVGMRQKSAAAPAANRMLGGAAHHWLRHAARGRAGGACGTCLVPLQDIASNLLPEVACSSARPPRHVKPPPVRRTPHTHHQCSCAAHCRPRAEQRTTCGTCPPPAPAGTQWPAAFVSCRLGCRLHRQRPF